MEKISPKSACINNGATLISPSIAAIIKPERWYYYMGGRFHQKYMPNSEDKTQMI